MPLSSVATITEEGVAAYLALARFAKPRAAEGARLERELRDAESVPDGTELRPAE